MRITHTPTPREEALAALGPHWPAKPGAVVARIEVLVDVTDGVLSVSDEEQPDRPGHAWWVVDGLIVPQDAGPAPHLPGCPVETVPDPVEPSPPRT